MRWYLAAIASIALAWSEQGGAQAHSVAERDVRVVVDSFFTAVRDERWTDATRWLDLAAFEQHFRVRVSQARAALPQPEITVEQVLADHPEMPRAVAEWQVAQVKRFNTRRSFEDFSDEFAGVTTFRALAALTVPEAASRWLQAHDGRWRMRELAQRDSCVAQALALILANVDSMVKREESRALGVAMNGDSIAYVVMASAGMGRLSSDIYESPPPIVHLRRSAGGVWKILPREHLLQSHGYFLPGGNLSCER